MDSFPLSGSRPLNIRVSLFFMHSRDLVACEIAPKVELRCLSGQIQRSVWKVLSWGWALQCDLHWFSSGPGSSCFYCCYMSPEPFPPSYYTLTRASETAKAGDMEVWEGLNKLLSWKYIFLNDSKYWWFWVLNIVQSPKKGTKHLAPFYVDSYCLSSDIKIHPTYLAKLDYR